MSETRGKELQPRRRRLKRCAEEIMYDLLMRFNAAAASRGRYVVRSG